MQQAALVTPLVQPRQVPEAPSFELPELQGEGEGMGEYVQHDAMGPGGSQQPAKAPKKPRDKTVPVSNGAAGGLW